MTPPTNDAAMLPLSGIRVLDLTHVISGPFCTMMLAHMGAEVVKVERPGTGDSLRTIPGYEGREGHPDYFNSVNNSKKSIELDFKNPAHLAAAHALVEKAQVLVENFAPGTADRLHMGWEDLRKINPALVHCSISGFGQTGPFANRAAIDPIIQAVTGLMSVTGDADGPPMLVGSPIGDTAAGMYAAFAIVSALRAAEKTGAGQHLDISMQGAMLYAMGCRMAETLQAGITTHRNGSENPFRVPSNVYLTKDRRYTMIHCSNDRRWQALCRAMEAPEWAKNPEFATMKLRQEHRDEINRLVAARFAERTLDTWLPRFEAEETTCIPISDYREALDNPQVEHRRQVVKRDHPKDGTVRVVGPPLPDPNREAAIARPPLLGEHGAEVLREWLGWTDDETDPIVGSGGN